MRCQSRRKVSEKEYFRGEKKFERERERKIMKFSSWIVLQRGVTFLASTIKEEEILFLSSSLERTFTFFETRCLNLDPFLSLSLLPWQTIKHSMCNHLDYLSLSLSLSSLLLTAINSVLRHRRPM